MEPGFDETRSTFLNQVWVVKDKATGDVHAVYQQLTDFNNDESNNVRIYDDYKGGLIFVDDSESCSIIPKCDSGHIIVRFEAGVPRGR